MGLSVNETLPTDLALFTARSISSRKFEWWQFSTSVLLFVVIPVGTTRRTFLFLRAIFIFFCFRSRTRWKYRNR